MTTIKKDESSISFRVTDVTAEKVQEMEFKCEDVLPNERDSKTGEQVKTSHQLVVASDFNCRHANTPTHSFVMAAFKCYSNHHFLVLKPDDVWIAITTQFSNYVNKHGEELRSKFVDFEGKKELVVSGLGNLKTANYESLCLKLQGEIAKNIKDPSIADWVVPSFSTTTNTDKVVGSIVLMSTTKTYFDYKFMLLCNLPGVTLLGNEQDWINLRNKADRLLEFDLNGELKKWSNLLLPVLDKLVEARKGNPDKEWWNKIANRKGGGSGPSYLSGWITTFCVFDNDGSWRGDNKEIRGASSEWPIIDMSEVQRGFVTVPITVDDNGKEYKTEMYAGHMASKVLDDEVSIAPSLGWALFTIN
ncbi:hypothetical protein AKO1_007360 [Acrasis kona]|uniref:Uncharacterized protein n=1 Tax=Acrasis kona TaxID=1008807 RepID=A0AAW2YR06_9EUKA